MPGYIGDIYGRIYCRMYFYRFDYEHTFITAYRILALLQRKLTLWSVQKPFSQRSFVAFTFLNMINFGNN
jgi:hypothetical protein